LNCENFLFPFVLNTDKTYLYRDSYRHMKPIRPFTSAHLIHRLLSGGQTSMIQLAKDRDQSLGRLSTPVAK
jgi:hypothetical protein